MFKMNTLGNYYDLYFKTDVLLLADILEILISTCLECSKLDPCYYFNSPGLSWDAILKMTGIELELISDIEIHLFIEEEMRGGISYIAKRHSKAINKYMQSNNVNNVHKTSKFIRYFLEYNLNGWVISQYLSYGGFEWLNQNNNNNNNKIMIGLM